MTVDSSRGARPVASWLGPASSQKLVVIAASAGGLAGLIEILAQLPADFPAAIAVVHHRGTLYPDLLPELLQRRTSLRVRHAEDGCVLEAGTVYICPPQLHMEVDHCLRLVEGPRLRHVRPSADLMLHSVARTHGSRAIAVVLSGSGADGAIGSSVLAESGGVVLVQDPSSCLASGMPTAALATAGTAVAVPVHEISGMLQRIAAMAPSRIESSSPEVAARTTVMLVDDHRIILDGLRLLLTGEPDIEVIAEACNGRDAVEVSAWLLPDVVVMDVAMPELDGVSATRRIRAQSPHTAIIALSADMEQRTADRILLAGATAYVCKTNAFTELAVAIRAATAHKRPSVGMA